MAIETALLIGIAAFGALYAIAAVARWPQRLVLAAIPLLLWPSTFDGIPIRQALTGLLIVGVVVSSRARIGRFQPLLVLLTALTGLLVASHYAHPATIALLPSESRNSMITIVLNAFLILVFALARPGVLATVKTFALSGVAAALYAALIGDASDGRLRVDGLNANSAGHAAALAALACLVTYQMSGRKRYLAVSLMPLYVVLLAQSRGGLVVLTVGLLVAWVLAKRGPVRWFVAAVAAVLAFALSGAAILFVQDYFLSRRDVAVIETESRFDLIKLAGHLIRSTPWGIGYGRFPDVSAPYLGRALNSHNDWLRIAAEAGVLAGVLLVVLLLSRVRCLPRQLQPILVAGAASMALGNVGADIRVSLPLWAFAGLAWGEWARRRESAGTYFATQPVLPVPDSFTHEHVPAPPSMRW